MILSRTLNVIVATLLLGGCAALDRGDGSFGANTGSHWVSATNYRDFRSRAEALCPEGYHVSSRDRDGPFDWNAHIQCRR